MAFLQKLMYGAGWQVRDAGGAQRGLYDYFQFSGEPPVPRSAFAAVRRACNQYEPTGGKRLLRTVIIVYVLWTAVSTVWSLAAAASASLRFVSVAWAALVFVAAWGHSRFIRCGPAAYAAELVAHGHCASCGYLLSRAAGELTTCPECGAAWVSAKVGSAVAEGVPAEQAQVERV